MCGGALCDAVMIHWHPLSAIAHTDKGYRGGNVIIAPADDKQLLVTHIDFSGSKQSKRVTVLYIPKATYFPPWMLAEAEKACDVNVGGRGHPTPTARGSPPSVGPQPALTCRTPPPLHRRGWLLRRRQ